jgi:hypothetical protein
MLSSGMSPALGICGNRGGFDDDGGRPVGPPQT